MPLKIKFETIELSKKDQPIEQWERKRKAVERALETHVGNILERGFNSRIQKWSKPPKIYRKVTVQATQMKLDVGPRAGGRWEWVSLGVKPRLIVPRKAKVLRFRTGYIPKTLPNNRLYGGPGKYIGDTVFRPAVSWPGIAPRNFEKHIVDESENAIFLVLRLALEKA